MRPREIVHVRATRHPTAAWVGQQLVNACFERKPPLYLIRDRDGIYGAECSRLTPVRVPGANAIAQRFAGILRRECLAYVFVFNERHLQELVSDSADYYNRHRPYHSLDQQPPCPAETGCRIRRSGRRGGRPG